MLVVLSSVTWDPEAYVELDVAEEQQPADTVRRVTREATLDGGVVLIDQGFTHGDRTIELSWVPRSAAQEELVTSMVRDYQRLNVSMTDGVYEVAPERYTPGADQSQLRLLVVAKRS